MQTLFGARLRQWSAHPRTPLAIVSPELELSFADLDACVDRCATWLVSEGCRPSDLIGITLGDEIPHLVVSLALLRLGLPQVCLPTYDPPPSRLKLAQRLLPARIVMTESHHALPGHESLLLKPEHWFGAAGNARCDALDADPDAAALYFTSSGTTGEPKIVALSQRTFARRAERRGIRLDDRVLLLTTVEDYPAKCGRIYCAYLGSTSVFQAGPASPPLAVHDLCARFGVTRIDVGALQAEGLARDVSAGRHLPANVNVFINGSRAPVRLREAFKVDGGARLFVEYGTRETGLIATPWPDDRDSHLETVGLPGQWIELEIVDGTGNALPADEIGEIRVRTADMVREYRHDPVATARHFKDGWFYPGDIGSRTVSGSVCIHGRADDMMNLNGIKIFPAEVERVLEEHPAVKAAAAFAVPSAIHGDIPVAAVELHEAAGVDSVELMAHARARLGVRAPRRIVVMEALPRNATGKIMKRDLVGMIVPGR
jgi:long-chain acyl-CoA synthetase